ncbi:hypothetical protein [Rubrivirga sp. IMCC45206]|uniref:hypothetical protein n=1 Tax=Rubrivirga sp. IMCC45206 TaxID=3391614 RepID=UPI00398FDDE4
MRALLLSAALALFAVGCASEPAEPAAPLGEAEVVTEPAEDLTDDDLLLDDAEVPADDLVIDDSTLVEGDMGDEL